MSRTNRRWPVYGLQEGLFPEYSEKWRQNAACASTIASVFLFIGAILLLSLIVYPWSSLPKEDGAVSARQYEQLIKVRENDIYIRDTLSLIALGVICLGGLNMSFAYGILYANELKRLKREQQRRDGIASLRRDESMQLTTRSVTYGGVEEFGP